MITPHVGDRVWLVPPENIPDWEDLSGYLKFQYRKLLGEAQTVTRVEYNSFQIDKPQETPIYINFRCIARIEPCAEITDEEFDAMMNA